MEVKRGRVEGIKFHNESNGYTVAVFETEDEQFTAVGCIPRCREGIEYVLHGDFVQNPKYGEQFAFSSFEDTVPESAEGIREFLSSGLLKGVGPKTADAMIHKFGDKVLEIIEKTPARLTEVSGIGEAKAESIAQSYSLHREFSEIAVYFAGFGIPMNQVTKLYEIYGSETIGVVEDNPYGIIFDVPSIGFRKADAIALKIGFDRESDARIKGGIMYVLSRLAGEGHVFYPKKELSETVGRALDVSIAMTEDCIDELVFEGRLMIEVLDGRESVYLEYHYNAECRVCKNLIALNSSKVKPVNAEIDNLIRITEVEKKISLSENQKKAIRTSVQNGISVITGGPGTGKTTIINTIIDVFKQGGLKTAIAAPTGRAAKRITETSGYPAVTIHRLLEYYYDDGYGDMAFGRNENNPLEYDAVIIDEASMVDLLLMDSLLKAMTPGTRLIIVGDADQLPSVGVGNVLRDIIESEYIYSVKLTEIFRQAQESLIVVNAHKINHGEYPDYNEKDKEFFFLRRKTEREMLESVKDLYARRLPAFYKDCVPVRDIQVLTPVRKGLIGVMNLNRELQNLLNPPSQEKAEKSYGDRVFRCGDKVMQIKNNYQLKWKNPSDFSEGEGVFNGDLGFVEEIDKDYQQLTVLFDDERYVTYEFSQLEELELAYAVTVHKSQGSEFPIVIMPVSWFPPMLATRNLLYTAVTRAKDAVMLVGSEDKLQAMVDNTSINARYSGLGIRLGELLGMGL